MKTFLHIHNPTVTYRRILTMTCPDCKRRSRLLGFHQSWYGWRDTCLRCGRTWDDGKWTPLPFAKNARAQQIAEVKARWRAVQGEIFKCTVVNGS